MRNVFQNSSVEGCSLAQVLMDGRGKIHRFAQDSTHSWFFHKFTQDVNDEWEDTWNRIRHLMSNCYERY